MADERPLLGSQLAVFKFCETSRNSRSQSSSIFNGAKQWWNLQSSLLTVHDSLLSRLSDFDSGGKGNCGGIDVRKEFVDLGEKLKAKTHCLDELGDKNDLIELYDEFCDEIESKEKRVKEECARLECKLKLIDDARKASDFVEVGIKEKCEALEAKEKRLNDAQRELELKEAEFKAKCEAFESEKKDMDDHKKVLEERELYLDKRCAKIGAKERDLELRRKKLEKQSKTLTENETKVKEYQKVLESKEKNLLGRLELKEKLIEERCAAIESKEMDFSLKVDLKEKEMEEHSRKINLNEERIMNEICKGVQWKLRQMNVHFDAVEMEEMRKRKRVLSEDFDDGLKLKGKEVSECCIEQEKEEMRVDAPCEELGDIEPHGLIEKQIDESNEKLESKEQKQVDVSCKDLEMGTQVNDEKQIDESNGMSELNDKEVSNEALELETNEAQVSSVDEQEGTKQIGENEEVADDHIATCGLTQPEKELPHSGIVCSTVESSSMEGCSDIHMFCKKMDVNGVRSYIVRCVKENNVLPDRIFDALRCASDPAKLVLETSKSFFETGLDKSDNDAINWSCLHLLEQLLKLSPSITSDVDREAKKVAAAWKERLTNPRCPINCFGFLHFVAAYKLAKHYERQMLLSIFKCSYFAAKLYPPEKNVDLSRVLEVQNKIPDFIRSLIKKQKPLEAIKCVHLFKLEHVFPPVPLLETYLEHVKQKVKTKLETWNSPEKVDPATVELSHLHGALHGIQQLKLEFMLPTDSLSLRINQLKEETKGTSRKRGASLIRTPQVLPKKQPRIESNMVSCSQSREGATL